MANRPKPGLTRRAVATLGLVPWLALASLPAPAAPTPPANSGGALTIEVGNVRNDRGRVVVDICPRERFLADGCLFHASAPAHAGTTLITIAHLPPGDWAAQAFHDENSDGEINRGLFGMPKEGVGFSRDARIVFSPPKWRDAVFAHGDSAQTIHFALRYFMGPASPAEWQKAHR